MVMYDRVTHFLFSLFVLALFILDVSASYGDRSSLFRELLENCFAESCSTSALLAKFSENQPLHLGILGWDCLSECKYVSMWRSVDVFRAEGRSIPQFYGKWPFVRIFGIQEPASMVFSILNGVAHLYMIRKLRRLVPSYAPMYYAWHFYCAVSVHTWFWSTVFHTRDLPFTERMDYYFAFLLNLMGLLMFCIRNIALRNDGLDFRICSVILGIIFIVFLHHIYLLSGPHFDYGYNMRVNIAVGLTNTAVWVSWSLWSIRKRPYLWNAMVSIVLANLLLLLEVGDFAPILWTFDAHSLWHGGTFPLVFLWYSLISPLKGIEWHLLLPLFSVVNAEWVRDFSAEIIFQTGARTYISVMADCLALMKEQKLKQQRKAV